MNSMTRSKDTGDDHSGGGSTETRRCASCRTRDDDPVAGDKGGGGSLAATKSDKEDFCGACLLELDLSKRRLESRSDSRVSRERGGVKIFMWSRLLNRLGDKRIREQHGEAMR